MAVLIDMKAALVKKEHVTWDEAHQEGGWQDGTTAPRRDGTKAPGYHGITMAPRHHSTTARLAAQTECV